MNPRTSHALTARAWVPYATAEDGPLAHLADRVYVLRDLASPQLGNRRDIVVLLPAGHDAGGRTYPVVYMQDGQNLFDPATSFASPWRAGEALDALHEEGLDAIIVGVPNTGAQRLDEYSPFRDARVGGGRGEAYVRFLSDTVKPAVDAAFPTRRGREDTFVAGSSMGGLISLYAICAHGEVFGGAGALSPALWFARRAFYPWLRKQSVRGRVSLRAGTGEGPLLLADVARLRDMLLERGLRLGRDLDCRFDSGGRHDESSWSRQLPGVLRFLLNANGAPPSG